MFGIGRTAAMAIAASVLGAGLLGSVALAALSPATVDTASVVPALPGEPAPANGPAGDRLRAILDGLVGKGVITQAQEDAILGAVTSARGDGRLLKRVFADLFTQSADYLGMAEKDLRAALPGTSLAALADATAGRSRDGLVAALTSAVDDAIAKALAEGKITQDQADKATADAPAHIASFVDHTYAQRTPKVRLPNVLSFVGDATAAARDYLGLDPRELGQQLRAGKSLGEVADATAGKSRDGLVAAITAAANAKIDAAVAGGKLTADQAADLRTRAGTLIGQLVDRHGPSGPGGWSDGRRRG